MRKSAGVRVVPERAPLLQIATVFAGLLLGPLGGLRLAMLLTPDSDLVQSLSVFAFVGVFATGLLVWMGVGVVTVVLASLRHIVRGRRPGAESLTAGDRIVPPGYSAFVLLGPLIACPVGLLAGLVSELSVVTGVVAWALAGLAYGWSLWWVARAGYLPFPEPE